MATQDEINTGQRQINYELCRVDMKTLQALKTLVDALKDVRVVPASAPSGPKEIDFTAVKEAISKAEDISREVADIRPPGCEAPTYPRGG